MSGIWRWAFHAVCVGFVVPFLEWTLGRFPFPPIPRNLKLTTPTPDEIRDQIAALPPFQRAAAMQAYHGLDVSWQALFEHVEQRPLGGATVIVKYYNPAKYSSTRISCETLLTPQLRVAKEDAPLVIRGKIGSVAGELYPNNFWLNDVSLEFLTTTDPVPRRSNPSGKQSLPLPPTTGGKIGRWVKAHKLRITLGSVLGVIAMYTGYVNTGADALRADVYQPLYQEVGKMETAIRSNNMSTSYSSEVYQSLNQNGNLGRIPQTLRKKIVRLYETEGQAHGHILPVAHKISEMMPGEITRIRNEAYDKEWSDKTVKQLNSNSSLSTGSFPLLSFSIKHTGIVPSIDMRDKAHPRVAAPGTVTWLVNDWMNFPTSASEVEKEAWPDTWFLGFDEKTESWYYRITHEDLSKNSLTLEEFLRPTYQKLAADTEFQQLLADNQTALSLVEDVKSALASRVQQPKQLSDLIDVF